MPTEHATMEDDLILIANATEARLLRRGGSAGEWLVLDTMRRVPPGPGGGTEQQPVV